MKTLSIAIMALVLTTNYYAQGLVEFDNLVVDAPISMPDGTGPGAAGRAQLYLLEENGYTPVGPIQGFITATPEAAYYLSGIIVPIPDRPAGTEATVQVRAWVDAPTWESALLRGESNDVTVTLLEDLGARLIGLQAFTLIPEPSTVTLGFLAAGTLLLTRRKQKAKP